jgi:hypothetical protein
MLPTYHEKIKIFAGPVKSEVEMGQCMDRIKYMCALRDVSGLVKELVRLEPEYTPSEDLLQRLPNAELLDGGAAVPGLRSAARG